MQATQQNSQNQFNNIQAQMTEDQKTETIRATSITLFLLAFASFDIGITLIPFSKRKKPETDGNHRKDAESQRKILEYLE
jgi:cbb3-type cytochrome oxidase subunit 3